MNTYYLDLYDNPAYLTEKELNWFNKICKECIEATGIDIIIECEDHNKFKGKSKEALGIFHTDNIENPIDGKCKITIDNYFIHECYDEVFNDRPNFTFNSLEHVIAHELAHTIQWRHCKRHTALTEKLYEEIKKFQNLRRLI